MTITISGSNGVTFSDATNQPKGLTVVNFTRRTWHTRVVPGDFNSKQYPEGWQNIQSNNINIERKHPNSIFLVKWTMSMRTQYSDCLHWRASWGGSGWYQGTMPYDAGFSANSRPFYTTMWMDTLPVGVVGSRNIILEYYTANGQTANRPAQIMNPNQRHDDNRYNQEYSSVTVFELAR